MGDVELPIKNYVMERNNDTRMEAGLMPLASGLTCIPLFRTGMGLTLHVHSGDGMSTICLNSKRLKDKNGKRRYQLIVEEV